MSLNLLTGYSSDDSFQDSDEDEYGEDAEEKEDGASTSRKFMNADDEDEKETEEQPEEQPKSFFSADFCSSSDEDVDEEEEQGTCEDSSSFRLPSARSVLTGTAKLESSLFISDAEKEQDANNAVLSQHVEVTEKVRAEQRAFRGKRKGQPCRQFLAGKCARGARCRFSHALPEETSGANGASATIESKPAFYTDANDVFSKKQKLN